MPHTSLAKVNKLVNYFYATALKLLSYPLNN